jgi:hypothetical protein
MMEETQPQPIALTDEMPPLSTTVIEELQSLVGMENPEFKPISPEAATAVKKALKGIHDRPYSGRHPELGKMFKCQVCGKRHRSSMICLQKFEVLAEDEDLETGERTTIYATAIPADGRATPKQVVGAAAFAKKRQLRRPNKNDLQIVEITRRIYNRDDFDPDKPEDMTFMQECRLAAAQEIRKKRELRAKAYRKRQRASRRKNR